MWPFSKKPDDSPKPPPSTPDGPEIPDALRPIYAPFLEQKAEWFEKAGLQCFHPAFAALFMDATNSGSLGIAHLEPGVAIVIVPPPPGGGSIDTPEMNAKLQVACTLAEKLVKARTRTPSPCTRLNVNELYGPHGHERWLGPEADADALDKFGMLGFLDVEWLVQAMHERARSHGARIDDAPRTVPGMVRLQREESVPVESARLLKEMLADLYPIDYLLQRIDAASSLERALADWAKDAPIAPGEAPADLGRRKLTRWSRTPGDESALASPQVAAIRELSEAADGLEMLLLTWLMDRFPKGVLRLRGGSTAALQFDPEKGVVFVFDHETTTLDERVGVLRSLIAAANLLRKHYASDGRARAAETGQREHFRGLLASIEKVGADKVDALGVVLPQGAEAAKG